MLAVACLQAEFKRPVFYTNFGGYEGFFFEGPLASGPVCSKSKCFYGVEESEGKEARDKEVGQCETKVFVVWVPVPVLRQQTDMKAVKAERTSSQT